MKKFFVILFLLLFLVDLSVADTIEEDLKEYRAAMRILADDCRRQGMDLEARVTQNRIWEDPPYGFFIPRPAERPLGSLPEDAAPRQRKWFQEMRRIEAEYGSRFLVRAKGSAAAGKGHKAFEEARLAFFIDPESEEAREIFGYRLYEGVWLRDWEIGRKKKGLIKDPIYGWITEREKERLTAGSETNGPRARSGKITVETEHFEVKTTTSRKEAAAMARHLEEFRSVWEILFFPMTVSEKEAAAVVLGKKEQAGGKHKVVIFRNRDEYLREILRLDAGGEISSGGYFPDKKTVYLYRPDPNEEDETPLNVMAIHEAAHQLFAETGFIRGAALRRRANPGEQAQFWMTEGIACYLETFKASERGWTVGGTASYRFLRAKERADEADGLLPIAQLAAMGKNVFQSDPQPAKLYTESAGLVSFFFHGDGGKYREAFLSSLHALYQGKESPDLLEKSTGTSYSRLDEEFQDFLRRAPFTE